MKRLGMSVLLAATVLVGSATAAAADTPDKNCWGVVSAQRAQLGDLGQHSAAQATPRSGLGNVTRIFGLDHVGELGTLLASLDGLDETSCG
ncbi:hypothetical protein [Salsipaludibacter albus]|uniref:hypothetical protein n=1 Tax=Salsipaludibacter albus TaxID=2849650 RepID=UPI001EE44395|nr:hypothetical protein [Salsipaludibacter albus]MBY5164041.1 hypothetical protein [Salsipaludibacter albus]